MDNVLDFSKYKAKKKNTTGDVYNLLFNCIVHLSSNGALVKNRDIIDFLDKRNFVLSRNYYKPFSFEDVENQLKLQTKLLNMLQDDYYFSLAVDNFLKYWPDILEDLESDIPIGFFPPEFKETVEDRTIAFSFGIKSNKKETFPSISLMFCSAFSKNSFSIELPNIGKEIEDVTLISENHRLKEIAEKYIDILSLSTDTIQLTEREGFLTLGFLPTPSARTEMFFMSLAKDVFEIKEKQNE